MDEILNLIESVSEGFPSYIFIFNTNLSYPVTHTYRILLCVCSSPGIWGDAIGSCSGRLPIFPNKQIVHPREHGTLNISGKGYKFNEFAYCLFIYCFFAFFLKMLDHQTSAAYSCLCSFMRLMDG